MVLMEVLLIVMPCLFVLHSATQWMFHEPVLPQALRRTNKPVQTTLELEAWIDAWNQVYDYSDPSTAVAAVAAADSVELVIDHRSEPGRCKYCGLRLLTRPSKARGYCNACDTDKVSSADYTRKLEAIPNLTSMAQKDEMYRLACEGVVERKQVINLLNTAYPVRVVAPPQPQDVTWRDGRGLSSPTARR